MTLIFCCIHSSCKKIKRQNKKHTRWNNDVWGFFFNENFMWFANDLMNEDEPGLYCMPSGWGSML